MRRRKERKKKERREGGGKRNIEEEDCKDVVGGLGEERRGGEKMGNGREDTLLGDWSEE